MKNLILRTVPSCPVAARAILLPVVILAIGACVPIYVPDPAVRYIAFGDSTTADESSEGYPEILRGLLDEPSETFANEGVSGETTEEGLIRLEALLSQEAYPEAQVLLYWEGGNDITEFIEDYDPLLLSSPDDPEYPYSEELVEQLDATQSNIESAVVLARQAGLEVFVATSYFLREDIGICDALPLDLIIPSQAQNANAYIELLNVRIREAGTGWGATIADVAAQDGSLRAEASNYADCNHLSGDGNAIAAGVFHDAIAGFVD